MNTDLLQKIDRIHPYPAKFTVDLAMEYIEKYSSIGDMVYDPFMGSGTTLLATSVLNRSAFGTDINHIAVLISRFKLLNLCENEIRDLQNFISDFEKNYAIGINAAELYNYPSINHWFSYNSICVLSYIKKSIEQLHNEKEKTFCELVMSSIVNTVSNQESDTRYAAIEKPNLTIESIANTFIKKFCNILSLFEEFNKENRNTSECKAVLMDSKLCEELIGPNSVDLILTSPPYVNTYDYYLYHKHRMNWLGYDVKYSMHTEIGSRREFSSLKREESKYNDDLFSIFEACNKTLKSGGIVVIVMGDGRVAGKMYDAKENMIKICSPFKWKLIDYSYTHLDQTSRSFQKSYRTKGKKEHVLVFKKGV